MKEKIRFALLGCGRIAVKHAEILWESKIKDAELVAVCDLKKDRAAKFGEKYSVPHYGDMTKMMTDMGDSIDVVSILTESGTHAKASGVRIHTQVFIPEHCVLEEDVWVGPHVVLTNARYPASKKTKANLEGVTLKRRCRIGANVTILPGIIVGENALIGAGSVVTKNVETEQVVCGVPAVPSGAVSDITEYE